MEVHGSKPPQASKAGGLKRGATIRWTCLLISIFFAKSVASQTFSRLDIAIAQLVEASQSNQRYGAVVDYQLKDIEPRFYLIDLADKSVLYRFRVAHGYGSDPKQSGVTEHFSNQLDTGASSLGLFQVEGKRFGAHGQSLVLEGRSPSNSNARMRFILIHSADYMELGRAPANARQRVGRSCGCFALSHKDQRAALKYLTPGSYVLAIGPEGAIEDERLPLSEVCCTKTTNIGESCLAAFPNLIAEQRERVRKRAELRAQTKGKGAKNGL